MDDDKLANFLERAIPSYINKAKKRELSTAQAARDFSNQLKGMKDRQRALELQNKFNNRLRRNQQTSRSNLNQAATDLDNGEFSVIIDGPSSIRPNQSVSFSAHTEGLNADELYIWDVEGGPYGVLHGPSGSSDSSKNYSVRTSADCQSGMLYITAVGAKSGGIGSFFVQVMGASTDPSAIKKQTEEGSDPEANSEAADTEDDSDEEEAKKQNLLQKWLSEKGKKVARDALKKLLTKEFWAGVGAFLAANWAWILLLILVTIAGIAIYAGIIRQAGSGAAGSTIHQEVDLANEANLVEKTLLATGDKDTKAAVINKTFPEMQKQLLALKGNADPTTKGKIEDTLTKIDQYTLNNDPALGKEIVASVKEILSALDQQAPAIQIQTRAPLDKITDYNFNLHYGTPLNKDMPKNGGHATYMYYGEGKADAVDLYGTAGSSIYPVFSGKVTDFSDDGTGHKKIVIENGDYQILYANFDPAKGLVVGQTVATTTPIGKIVDIEGQTQIHIELAYQGKSITTTELDQINYKQSDKPWGQYLWEQMKKILNLK